MVTWHCVNCDTLLVEAPTDKGHMDCGPHGQICFECIKRMSECMNAVCAAEQGEAKNTSSNSGFKQCLCKGTAGLTSGSIIIRRDCPLHGSKNMQL